MCKFQKCSHFAVFKGHHQHHLKRRPRHGKMTSQGADGKEVLCTRISLRLQKKFSIFFYLLYAKYCVAEACGYDIYAEPPFETIKHFSEIECGIYSTSNSYEEYSLRLKMEVFIYKRAMERTDETVTQNPSGFNVWTLTNEARTRDLVILVEGPSTVNIKDHKDCSCCVTYNATEPGDYRVGIKFKEQYIPDSSFFVYIIQRTGEANKIEFDEMPAIMTRNQLTAIPIIIKNADPSKLNCIVTTPSGKNKEYKISYVEGKWALIFVPYESGIYVINIRYNDIHIPESPLRLRIGVDDADPAAVQANGQGLKEAETGTEMEFIVDTCSAGIGTLGVTIDGPSKVAMDCTEVEEGYKVRYTPLAPGDYFITVKYNGYQISGSPFKVSCSGNAVTDVGGTEQSSVVVDTVAKQAKQRADNLPTDPAKDISTGVVLKRALLHEASQFTRNWGDARNNVLSCAIHGPKDRCDEVHVKHLGRNLFQVNYTVKEKGNHTVFVKWGEDHIPGSPFKVEVS